MDNKGYTYYTHLSLPGRDQIDRLWTLRSNTQDEFIVKEVYEDNCYNLPDDLKGKVIIDIGSSIKAFAAACIDRGADIVYCFDPFPEMGTKLFPYQVVQSPFAVVGDSGPEYVYMSEERRDEVLLTGGSNTFCSKNQSIARSTGIGEVVQMVLGDLDNRSLWIKLDCEGSEYEILASNLPWDRIERIFGECHTLINGKLSRDTSPIENGRFPIEPNIASLVSCLVSHGYRVETLPNPDDPHLNLFWAFRQTFRQTEESDTHDTHGSLGSISKAIEYEERLNLLESGNISEVQSRILNDLELDSISGKRSDQKTVAILTPFRNARKYLRLYFSQLSTLRDLLSNNGYSLRLVAAEGDSLDCTRDRIITLSDDHNIPLTLVDTTHGKMKWSSVEDPVRMKVMSDVMNKALDAVEESDSIVVWIMSDLEWIPDDILDMIEETLHNETGTQDIFVPRVLNPNSDFYDTWAFRFHDERFIPKFPYNNRFSGVHDSGQGLFEIHSAGTCLVMTGEVARNHRAKNNEVVSFCESIRKSGHRIWLDWDKKVYHCPVAERKSILWISDAVCISGFARVAHAVFPILAESGYDLEIIALNYWGHPHNLPYTIWPAQGGQGDISGTYRLQSLLWANRGKYGVIISLDDIWNIPRITKSLSHLKGLDETFIPPPVVAWTTIDGCNTNPQDVAGTNALAVTSFGAKEIERGDPEWIQGSIPVIPFGVDTNIFYPQDRLDCRSKVLSDEIPIDSFIIGYVGTNQLRKNIYGIVEVFSEMARHKNNVYLYLCLGPGDDSGCDISRLIEFYGIQNRVIINRSLLSDELLSKVYNTFDVYLSLSFGEGFGLTVIEAMACGVACIVTDWSGYGWIPDDCAIKIYCNSTCITAPLNSQGYVIGGIPDRDKTVQALNRLYNFPEMRDKLSSKGLSLARSMTWESTGNKLVEAIESVIHENCTLEVASHG